MSKYFVRVFQLHMGWQNIRMYTGSVYQTSFLDSLIATHWWFQRCSSQNATACERTSQPSNQSNQPNQVCLGGDSQTHGGGICCPFAIERKRLALWSAMTVGLALRLRKIVFRAVGARGFYWRGSQVRKLWNVTEWIRANEVSCSHPIVCVK